MSDQIQVFLSHNTSTSRPALLYHRPCLCQTSVASENWLRMPSTWSTTSWAKDRPWKFLSFLSTMTIIQFLALVGRIFEWNSSWLSENWLEIPRWRNHAIASLVYKGTYNIRCPCVCDHLVPNNNWLIDWLILSGYAQAECPYEPS